MFSTLEKAIATCFQSEQDIHWKGILDVREALMEFIEWAECFHPLQSNMTGVIERILKKHTRYNADTLGYMMKHGMEPFSKVKDPLGLVLRMEQIVLLLMKLIYTQPS